MKKITVGQKLYGRRKDPRGRMLGIEEFTVKAIAKKYFDVEETSRRYLVETLQYEDKVYGQNNQQLYLTREEIELQDELNRLYDLCRDAFNPYNVRQAGYTLDQLRQVYAILKP